MSGKIGRVGWDIWDGSSNVTEGFEGEGAILGAIGGCERGELGGVSTRGGFDTFDEGGDRALVLETRLRLGTLLVLWLWL